MRKTWNDLNRVERLDVMDKAIDSFPYFVENIFSESKDILKGGEWTGGEFINDITQWLQDNPRTIRVSAKDHFKSMSFYAHIMWKILRLMVQDRGREIQYFSYKELMSSYHLAKIKVAIACNPWFSGIIDKKGKAESVISYSWNGIHSLTVTPRGLMEFNRGIHCDDVYVDDPLQDPENKLILTRITKINELMKLKILDMPQQELHIVGTTQTNADFFFDKNFTSRFSVRFLPAIVNEAQKISLWPEWMSFDELMAKKIERGPKTFNQEYLCSPVYTENAFIDKEKYDAVVNKSLKNHTINTWLDFKKQEQENETWIDWDVVGGWDLGKKAHPSHFVLFRKVDGKRVQIHSRWFDGVDYQDQLEHIRQCIDAFGVTRVFFDATRGELEMAIESGELPAELEPVVFTSKAKYSMAREMDKAINNKSIEFVNDERQKNQMLLVTNDLKAPETPEGHGDSFWSVGLSFKDIEDEGTDIHFA